jgi:hypothetical protein
VTEGKFPVDKQQAMKENKARMAEYLYRVADQTFSAAALQSGNGSEGPV